MSYERSAVSPSTQALPNTDPIPQMREDREIDPYRSSKRMNEVLAKKQDPVTPTTVPKPNGQQAMGNSEPGAKLTEEANTATPTTEETVRLSPQMAALARKEQRFRREEQALKAKEATLNAERAEIEELKALKQKLANKDYSGIENLVKYDDYTQYLIEKDSNLTPEQQALKKLEMEIDGVKKAQTDDISKRFEAAVQERRKAVTSLVATNEEFSSIKELKLEEAVVQHILDTWEHENVDLSPEEAAQDVEKELLERAGRWSSLSKLKAKTDETEETKELPPLKPQVKTLTNNMSATGEIKRVPKSFQHMSDSERYAEARRRAEEKLKLKGR